MRPSATPTLGLAIVLLGCGCAEVVGIEPWSRGGAGASSGQGGASTSADGSSSAGSSPGGAGAYVATVLADSPAAYWRLGETSGTELADVVGRVSGAAHGDVTLGVPGGLADDSDTAIQIGAQSGYVVVGDHFDFAGTADFSIEAWVMPTTVDDKYRRLVGKEDPTANQRDGYLLVSSASALAFERWHAGNPSPDHVQADPLEATQFSHVVVTLEAKTLTLYVNGVVGGTSPASVELADTMWPVVLGANRDGYANLDGVLDEVAFYDHALSKERVLSHYAAAK